MLSTIDFFTKPGQLYECIVHKMETTQWISKGSVQCNKSVAVKIIYPTINTSECNHNGTAVKPYVPTSAVLLFSKRFVEYTNLNPYKTHV